MSCFFRMSSFVYLLSYIFFRISSLVWFDDIVVVVVGFGFGNGVC